MSTLTDRDVEILQRHLPQNPCALITGKKLSQEQSREIILRTDYAFSDQKEPLHEKKRALLSLIEFPVFRDGMGLFIYSGLLATWQEKWGYVKCTKLINNIIDSDLFTDRCWCHPDGIISSYAPLPEHTGGIGVYKECATLYAAFPFLEMTITLFADNDIPQMTIVMKDTDIRIHDPYEEDTTIYHKEHTGHSIHTYWVSPVAYDEKGESGIEELKKSAKKQKNFPADFQKGITLDDLRSYARKML